MLEYPNNILFMSKREKEPIIPIKIMPVEEIVRADGSKDVGFLISGKTKENVEAFTKAIEESGAELKIKKYVSTEEANQIIRNSGSSRSFGFSNWNCGWNPKGPRPNWENPKDPSVN
jgi:hypothetical protein